MNKYRLNKPKNNLTMVAKENSDRPSLCKCGAFRDPVFGKIGLGLRAVH
jgi:hypothetical protein